MTKASRVAWGWLACAGLALGAACDDKAKGTADSGVDTASAGDSQSDTASADDSQPSAETEVVTSAETGAETVVVETSEASETVATDESDGAETATPITLDGPCDQTERFGRFSVEAQKQWAIVTGAVANGVVPNTVMTEAAHDGACKLMQKKNPICDPPCQPGEACGLDSQCVPYPLNYDVGTVTIRGLVGPVEMKARAPAEDYSNTSLSNPPFAPGAEIRLSNSGTPAFALDGAGFTPITPTGDTWNLARGEAIEVGWDAPVDAQPKTRVELQILVDQHGSSPMFLTCDFDDTGSGTVTATMVNALLDAGISGFPSGKLARATTDSASLGEAGCVEFKVSSPRTLAVRVAGHVPCKKQADCPQGKTCNLTTETCE